MTSAKKPIIIYKICPQEMWRADEEVGQFTGAPIDIQDGYIHFSTASQVRETAARHFARQHDLMLVAVSAPGLGAALLWEPSRGGDLFPHLYAPLLMSSVLWTRPMPVGEDGLHVFPDELPNAPPGELI